MTDSDATTMDKGDYANEVCDQCRCRHIGNHDQNRSRTVTKTVTRKVRTRNQAVRRNIAIAQSAFGHTLGLCGISIA